MGPLKCTCLSTLASYVYIGFVTCNQSFILEVHYQGHLISNFQPEFGRLIAKISLGFESTDENSNFKVRFRSDFLKLQVDVEFLHEAMFYSVCPLEE